MSATFTPYFEAKAHRDPTGSGAYIRVRVPDGLEIVLLWIGEKVPATGPPSWLYWYY